MKTVAENLRDIRERIARAAERSGRSPEAVRLVVVTKTRGAAAIREALEAGAREIGESYVQEAERKWPELPQGEGVVRHLIGHLQRNKAGKAAALFDVVQSVDSRELAEALGRRAKALDRTLDVLVEVNIAGEASKFGAAPEQALALCGEVAGVPGLRLAGLMGIGPAGGDEAATARSFRRLRDLFEELPRECRQVLSMGMTGDFELAIAEGSTMVRVGAGIFGPRSYR